jgi:hypothetical protein
MANTDSAMAPKMAAAVGSVDLTLPGTIGAQPQYVQDQFGNQSPLSVGSGNVGVGTNAPISTLTVLGGGSPPLVVQGSSQNYAMLGLLGDGAAQMWQLQATNMGSPQFRIAYPQNDPWMVIQPTGEVGIGTQSPQAKLDVNGTIRATGLSINGPLSLQGNTLAITGLTTPPSGVSTIDLVVDPNTGRIYRQN